MELFENLLRVITKIFRGCLVVVVLLLIVLLIFIWLFDFKISL